MRTVILLMLTSCLTLVLTAQNSYPKKQVKQSHFSTYVTNHSLGLSVPNSGSATIGEVNKTGNIVTTLDSIYFKYYDMGVWETVWKYTYAYDGNGRCLMEEESEWVGGSWNMSYRYEYTYYSTGNIETIIMNEMVGGSWERQWKTVFAYNSSNQLIEELEYQWSNNQWKPFWRMTVYYNSNGLEIADTSWHWSSPLWSPAEAREYSYDASNRLEERISQHNSGGTWYLEMKKVFEYNNADQMILELEYERVNNNWEINSKDTIAYDANGFMNQLIDYYWSNGAWKENDKIDRTNDAVGNILTEIYSFWMNGGWAMDEKTEAQYDASIPVANIGSPYWFQEDFISKVLDHTFYSYSGTSWVPEEDADLYYSSFIEVPINNKSVVKVYPNPASDFLVVESEESLDVEVFNMLGSLTLKTKTQIGKHRINLQGVLPGVYLIRINNQKTIKIIKR